MGEAATIWSTPVEVLLLVGCYPSYYPRNQVVARASKLDEDRVGSSVYIREKMVSVGLQLWAQQPIIGHGAGQFSSLSGFRAYAHNNYVELLANDGIIGLVLYYILPAAMLFIVLRPRARLAPSGTTAPL